MTSKYARYIDPLSTRSCATNLVCHECGLKFDIKSTTYSCCGKTLDIEYDYDIASELLAENVVRSQNVWGWEELLPIRQFKARATVGFTAGNTPLISADRLAAELGLKNLYIKDDSTQRPSLSYKDRVVSMGIARALELGKTKIAAVSTGNVGISVAALAAKAGIGAYILYPDGIEEGKMDACRALGAHVIQHDGATFDDVNRLAKDLCSSGELDVINVSLRSFYAEGAKTVAFEVIQQLKQAPTCMVVPVAGGTLSSRIWKGLREYGIVSGLGTPITKVHLAQAASSDPVAALIKGETNTLVPQIPESKAAPSLNIGAPGDGMMAAEACRDSGGSAASASEDEIYEGIKLLARTEGILTEGAGGVTVASLVKLVNEGKITRDDEPVAVISGSSYKVLGDIPKITEVEHVSL